jgi:hypothetical protein
MDKNGDTSGTLSKALGIHQNTLSLKINERGTEFTQSEIMTIKNRYNLTADDVDAIFFDIRVS